MNEATKPQKDTQATSAQCADAAPARVTSQKLLGAARALIIQHDGREYHLRLTQNGKLILTA